jgi:hypothetical protein
MNDREVESRQRLGIFLFITTSDRLHGFMWYRIRASGEDGNEPSFTIKVGENVD